MLPPDTPFLARCAPFDRAQARLLVQTVPGPCLVADVDGDVLSVLAIDPLLRRFVTGARHPADPMPGERFGTDAFGLLRPGIDAAMRPGAGPQTIEVPIGDEPQWFELVVSAVHDDSAVRQVLVFGADRTADHDMEQRSRRSMRRYEAMVANAPGLILLVDSAGRVLRASPGVESLLGFGARELIGRTFFEILHPETLARAATIFNQILSSPGEPIPIDDFRVSHIEGPYRWCEATATNLLHDDDIAAIVFNAHDVTDRRIAEERLELLATSDALTGLPNRRRLRHDVEEAFDRAVRTGSSVGLVLVDLDDFKLVNDALGHDIGDAVLRIVAGRIENLADRDAMVARIGGDEFAVLVPDLTDGARLESIAERVHDSLRSAAAVGGHDVFVRASVGTTRGHPSTSGPDALLRSADLALYRAKRNGRNQTVAFTAELQIEAEDRLSTVTALQRALREDRLRLVYQPVVHIDGRLAGAEALLRWEHDGKLLSPAGFLGLAEDTGLILPIGAWVLEQACRDLQVLRSAAPDLGWVSVNLSSRQLIDSRLPTLLSRTLDQAGLEPGALGIEVAEHTIRDDAARDVLGRLDGVRIMLSVTDLTGDRDALRRIDDLHLHAIKLDRSFVQQLDIDPAGEARALAAAVLELAAGRGLRVVAEGVETPGQRQVLRELGCPLVQGFLYSEPLDVASFITRGTRGPSA